MAGIKKSLVVLFGVISFYTCDAQSKVNNMVDVCCDTIRFGNKVILLNLPSVCCKHKKNADTYDEGHFIVYPFRDSAYVFIHIGANVSRPFCDTTQVKKINDNDSMICYCGLLNNLWLKEVYYKNTGITISCVNFREEDLPLFDCLLADVKYNFINDTVRLQE